MKRRASTTTTQATTQATTTGSLKRAMDEFGDGMRESLDALGRNLSCAICMSLPRKPVKLACSHYFCSECIEALFSNPKATCPTCRAPCRKRESRRDERFEEIVEAFTGVLACAARAMDVDEVPFASQIPREQLEANGVGQRARRTSASMLKNLRANMKPLAPVALPCGAHEVQGEEPASKRRKQAGASSSAANKTTDEERQRRLWTGPVIDPSAEVQGEHKCAFCKRGSEVGENVQNFKEGKQNVWSHVTCALWAPQCVDAGGKRKGSTPNLINVCKEARRASRLRCAHCKKTGAAAGCFNGSCRKSYHIWCARLAHGTTFDDVDYSLTCGPHSITQSTPTRTRPRVEFDTSNLERLASVAPSDASYDLIDDGNPPKPHIVGSHLTASEKALLLEFCDTFDCVRELSVTSQTTHVVMGKSKVTKEMLLKTRSEKYFFGVINGCWILSSAWIHESNRANKMVDEDKFEIQGDTFGNERGPMRGRLAPGEPIFTSAHFIFAGAFDEVKSLEPTMMFARKAGASTSRIVDVEDVTAIAAQNADIQATSAHQVFIIVDDGAMKTAKRRRLIERVVPFAKTFRNAAAILPVRWLLDSISRREMSEFEANTIEALENASVAA